MRWGKSNFDTIIARRDVIASLNSLDKLIVEARLRKEAAAAASTTNLPTTTTTTPSPPSTLPPTQILTAHLLPLLLTAQQSLNEKLTTTTTSNGELITTIEAQRREIRALMEMLEKRLGDVEGAVEVLGECVGSVVRGVEEEEGEEEIWRAEVEDGVRTPRGGWMGGGERGEMGMAMGMGMGMEVGGREEGGDRMEVD